MNRLFANEYKPIHFLREASGTWIEEWPLHQSCHDWYMFTGFLADKKDADHEFFIRGHYKYGKSHCDRHELKVSFLDLQTGIYYSSENSEFVSMDETGRIRTNSSILVPFFDRESLLWQVQLETMSLRILMTSADRNICHVGKMDHSGSKKIHLPGGNMHYSLPKLDTEGVLFYQQKDGSKIVHRLNGEMWFDRVFGHEGNRDVVVRPEWCGVL